MNRDEVIEHVAIVLHEKNEERRGLPWVRAGRTMQNKAREHSRVALDALEALGYARGPDDITALMSRTFETGMAIGQTAERYAAAPYFGLENRIADIGACLRESFTPPLEEGTSMHIARKVAQIFNPQTTID